MPVTAASPRHVARRHGGTRVPAFGNARGAILVQTAIMLVGLTALSAFVVDYGVLWTARRQAQNAADAAAMAAAMSLAFEAPGDQTLARANAVTAVANNPVWGMQVPIQPGDITFPACPAGSIGSGGCVRVQVLRTDDNGAALPTIFGALVGVTQQGVRAMATAQVLYGNATDCVKPLAIPDRWNEQRNNQGPPTWEMNDTFERYGPTGQQLPGVVDIYEPPAVFPGPNGTGFSRGPSSWTGGDYGRQFELFPSPNPLIDLAGGERFIPVQIDDVPGPGPYLDALLSCSPRVVQPGDMFEAELSNIDGETSEGIRELIARDPAATWDPSKYGGRGGVSGGCMATGTCCTGGTCTGISPRIIALPVYNPDLWDQNPPTSAPLTVSRVVGFFIESYFAPEIIGRLMVYPALPRSSMTASPSASFVTSVTLVR